MIPLKRLKFVKIKLSDVPDDVIQDYNLHEKMTPDGGYTLNSSERYTVFPRLLC